MRRAENGEKPIPIYLERRRTRDNVMLYCIHVLLIEFVKQFRLPHDIPAVVVSILLEGKK